MKKYLKISFVYIAVGLAYGVFFREFTKFNSYSAYSALNVIHPHVLILGGLVFMLLGLFSNFLEAEKSKIYKWFMYVYNIGLPFMSVMMLIRGILTVLGTDLSSGVNGMISGIAGVSHVMVGAGLVLLLVMLIKAPKKEIKN